MNEDFRCWCLLRFHPKPSILSWSSRPHVVQCVSQKALLCVPEVPQRADHKVVDIIDQLVSRVVGGSLSPKERALLKEDPAYW